MVEVILLDTGDRLDVIGDVNYTKMVSDIGDISKINTSFTWSLRFPKTPRNAMALDGLGINGSESTKPYETIKVALIENGFPILRNGNLQITETNKTEYVGNIKDGIIDFFNSMGDESLADLDISELDHNNTVQEIFATWNDTDNNLPYKYLLANYNGKFLADVDGKTNFSNTSLIPSAKVSYLLDKLFEKHGWTYSGLDLDGLYLSYPLNSEYDVTTGLVVGSAGMNSFAWTLSKGTNSKEFEFDTSGNDPEYITILGNYFIVAKAGAYGINLPQYDFEGRTIKYYVPILNVFQFLEPGFYPLGHLNIGDIISVMLLAGKNSRKKRTYSFSFQGDVTIHRLDASLISFSSNLGIFKQRDFIKEIMMQNAVISIADATKKHIEFATLDQRLNSSEVEDWSKYFVEKEKETYILGSYAQNNYLKHKYSNDGEDYNDGNIKVDNKNLKIDNTLFESKAYTNERLDLEIKTPNSFFIPTLKTFEIEVKEQGGNVHFEYNTLTDRMFFCTYRGRILPEVYVNSEKYDDPVPVAIPLTFESFVATRYNDIDFIINNAKLVTLKLALPSLEVLNLDFTKKYMFQQINGLYLIDRLNYKAGGVSTVDFIKIG